MLLTVYCPSPVDVVPVGKINKQRILVWRRAEIDIQEVPASSLHPAADLTFREQVAHNDAYRARYPLQAGDAIKHHYFRVEGIDGLTRAIADDSAEALQALERTAFNELLGRPPPDRNLVVHDDLPPVRQIIEDHWPNLHAKLVRAAANCAVVDGRIYGPVDEPYIQVWTDGKDGYEHCSVLFEDKTTIDHRFDTFPITQMRQAIAFARTQGASDRDIDEIESNFRFDLLQPACIRYDPVMPGLVAAAFAICEHNKGILQRLEFAKIAAWAHLRDALPAVQSKHDGDIATFVEKIRVAYAALKDEGVLTRYGKDKNIDRALAAYDRQPIELADVDVDALASPAA